MSKQRADRYPNVASFTTALVNSATSQPHSLTSFLAEFPTIESGSSTGLKSNISTIAPASTYNSSVRITKQGMYESNSGSATLDDRQYNTAPQRTNVDPITPIPPSYHPNPVTPIPLIEADKQGVIGTSPAGALANTTQFPSPKGWPVSNIPQKRKHTVRNRWLYLATACMVIFTSVIGIFVIPGFISQSKPPNHTVVKSAKLGIQTSILDFGKPYKGIKAILPIKIDNTGGQSLNWTADTGGAAGLKLNPTPKPIEPGRFQLIDVTADTSQLALKVYTATIAINSNGGNEVVGVKLSVQGPPPRPQAKLNVNPRSLNFAPLGANMQATLTVTVGNVGNQALKWTANIANATWLTIPMDNSSGTVQPGGFQQIQVTANTFQLAAGTHPANLSITSNGGKTTVPVTLLVHVPPPSPTPTFTPPPSPTPTDTPTPTSTTSSMLTAGQMLSENQSLKSNSGQYTLIWLFPSSFPS